MRIVKWLAPSAAYPGERGRASVNADFAHKGHEAMDWKIGAVRRSAPHPNPLPWVQGRGKQALDAPRGNSNV